MREEETRDERGHQRDGLAGREAKRLAPSLLFSSFGEMGLRKVMRERGEEETGRQVGGWWLMVGGWMQN